MAKAFDLLVPISQIYRRSFVVAASVVSAGDEGDPDISLAPDQVALNEGDWVTIDTDGKVKKAVKTDSQAWPVWTGGTRYDVRAGLQVTVIYGPHIATTTVFDPTGLAVGDELMVDDGTPGQLIEATSGNRVVAFLEKVPFSTSSQYPNGHIQYSTLGAGYVKA